MHSYLYSLKSVFNDLNCKFFFIADNNILRFNFLKKIPFSYPFYRKKHQSNLKLLTIQCRFCSLLIFLNINFKFQSSFKKLRIQYNLFLIKF